VRITPVSPERLVEEVTDLVDSAGAGARTRVAVDGAPPTRPEELATAVAARLRARGRPALVVVAADFLRPASLRLELGRTDPDAFLDGWLDVAGLRREVLDPAGPRGSGRLLPRLWDAAADRAHRDDYVTLREGGVLLLAGALLLGRGLEFELTVHLRMSEAALRRRLDAAERWTLPAYARYDAERNPADDADLLVLADHPERPAVRRRDVPGHER
jgi:hypothetical protein